MTNQALGNQAYTSPTEDLRRQKYHFASLDGLRGLAVLAVVTYHFGLPVRGGFLGVDLFFVLSGFVVTNNLIRNCHYPNWKYTFFIRRLGRLVPVMLLALVAVSIISAFDKVSNVPQAIGIFAALSQTYNIAAAHTEIDTTYLIHFWSLSIEFQFYVLAPLLVLSWRRFGSRRAALFLLIVVGLITATRLGLVRSEADTLSIYLNSALRLDGLLAGSALAMAPRQWLLSVVGRFASPSFYSLLVVFAFSPNFFSQPLLPIGFGFTFVLITTSTCIIYAVNISSYERPSSWHRICTLRPLVAVGHRSYSIYVWHFIIWACVTALAGIDPQSGQVELIALAFQIVATVIISEFSYRLVEQPLRKKINNRFHIQLSNFQTGTA